MNQGAWNPGRSWGARCRVKRVVLPIFVLLFGGCSGVQDATNPMSPQAQMLANLWWAMCIVATLILLAVMVALLTGVWRSRGRRGEAPLNRRQSRNLVLAGGVILPAIVLPILLVSSVSTHRELSAEPPENALTVEVIGRRWWWEIRYLQHANMAFWVVAEPSEVFSNWLARERAPAVEFADPVLARGQQVFLSSPCVLCHSIRGTTALGRVAPVLTHLASRRTLAAGTLPNNRGNLAGWILDPQHVKPGNKMPPVNYDAESLHPLLSYLESLMKEKFYTQSPARDCRPAKAGACFGLHARARGRSGILSRQLSRQWIADPRSRSLRTGASYIGRDKPLGFARDMLRVRDKTKRACP